MRIRAACVLFILGRLATAQTSTLPELQTTAATITPGNLLRHIRELSSDAYGGRLPGTRGEEKSVAYVISQIKAIEFEPGTPSGGFVQKVPLYGTQSRGSISITASGKDIPMSPPEDFVLWSNLPEKRIEVRDSDLVFAGYGVVAPEYQWDDYSGFDVKGKTVMVPTGDPPVVDRVTRLSSTNMSSWVTPLPSTDETEPSWRPHSNTELLRSSWSFPPSLRVPPGKITHGKT